VSTFSTDTIFILGKGASVDKVNLAVLANNLVIGLNDSERIAPCDITIFREEWVRDALEDNGYRSRLYICPMELSVPQGDVAKAKLVSGSDGAADMMMSRLLSDHPGEIFAIEDI
jgi:hypothetical protein